MESQDLFVPEVLEHYLNRISNVQSSSKPLWGKMNAAQAMAHLAEPFLFAMGEMKPERNRIGRWFGWMLKNMLKDPRPYPHNAPTSKDFLFPSDVDFETSKNKLTANLIRFHKGGPDLVTDWPHPFFGKLTPQEWSFAMSKHLNHHLTQFGV